MQAYQQAWKRAFDFSGRTSRIDYWTAVGVNILIVIVVSIIDAFIMTQIFGDNATLATFIYGLAFFIPGLALVIRRLRDAGRTPWWLLSFFIPIIGPLFVFVIIFFLLQGSASTDTA